MEKVLIAITTAETVHYETMESIYNLDIPEGVKTELKIVHAYNVADGRNNLTDYFLSSDCTHILFVDSDIILPKNALCDLLNMQWYICTGIAYKKNIDTIVNPDPYAILYYHEESNKTCFCPHFAKRSLFKQGIITPVDCCGLYCTLIKKELFDMIKKPYFFFAHEEIKSQDKDEPYCIGEDMWFCRKVIQEAGIQIWAHGSVNCKHIGKYYF